MIKDKWIYTFALDKEVTVEKSERTKDESGAEITITKKVKENKPFTFKVKKPTRKIIEDADLFYGVKVGEYLKAGLLSRNLIAKRLENDGGDLSESDKTKYSQLLIKFYEVRLNLDKAQKAFDENQNEENKQKFQEAQEQFIEVKNDLTDFEMQRSALFDQSAESKAYAKQIFWLTLHLVYWDKNGGTENFEPYFIGNNFEEKCDDYDLKEDGDEDKDLFEKINRKLAFVVSYWFSSGSKASEADIKKAESEITL